MLNDFPTSPSISHFLQTIQEKPEIILEKILEGPKAFLSSLIYTKLNKPIVIISGSEKISGFIDNMKTFTGKKIWEFPAWEIIDKEPISNLDIVGKRFELLSILSKNSTKEIILCPLQAAMQYVVSKEILIQNTFSFAVNTECDFEKLSSFFPSIGYKKVSLVVEKGQFALRGGIIDIFPSHTLTPYRLEFFGDEITEIRSFDPESQKSESQVSCLSLFPADETTLIKMEKTDFFSYLSRETILIFEDLLSIEDKYSTIHKTLSSLPFFFSLQSLFSKIQNFSRIYCTELSIEKISGKPIANESVVTFEMFNQSLSATHLSFPFHGWREYADPSLDLEKKFALLDILKENFPTSYTLYIYTYSDAERQALQKYLDAQKISSKFPIHFIIGYLTSGFILSDAKFAIISYAEVTQRFVVHREKMRSVHRHTISTFHELEIGEYVVHLYNGVGKFLGMEKQINHAGQEVEFFILEYANASRLYVPITQSHLISRYLGISKAHPKLHTLGTKKWQNTKVRTEKAIIGYAKDLLEIQAKRDYIGGFSYPKDSEDMHLFEEDFPFNLTEDQKTAVDTIKQIMESPRAMDLLLCGDVGYGKTEVAMRAAFKAIFDGKKQVAVLVPTTILALQHFQTFTDRMTNFPIRIGMLSRGVTAQQTKKVLKELADGSLDLVVGTHRLLSKDIIFHNLGLLIIDEEQRFGVKAKENMKKYTVGVDCITLSATPIPRTLYFSLVGARDLAVINTPPQDRVPIKTIISETDNEVIRGALLREFMRDGQSYFIHNRIESIHRRAQAIQTLIPEAKIGIVHGQLDPDSTDDIFHKFKEGKLDILIATTILENGVDIPNANTILIDRSDRFGLSELYQLRGRVGRWNRLAYAYFLIPPKRVMSEVTGQRLQALVESSGFGGGMKLALKDLEIRGAGDILGTKQSGHVMALGFHLYCKLLKQTIQSLQKNRMPLFIETKIEHPFDVTIPENYIQESNIRLEFYHRFGEAAELDESAKIFDELRDRFGTPPISIEWLYHLTRIRIIAEQKDCIHIYIGKDSFYVKKRYPKTIRKVQRPLPNILTPKKLEEIVSFLIKDISVQI
ncbi:MAG: transcription-repair coupling factor [Chlamydiales bacterium]